MKRILNAAAGRLLEGTGTVLLILLTSPILLITAILVWATDRGPILYRQTRAGHHGTPFQLFKFRSMRVNNRPVGSFEEIQGSDPLVTPIGKFIRRSKIDELPQLFNVIRGEMAWVGPRPTVLEQVERYTEFQRRRLEVLPGLTGWAQVNGGAEIPWQDRIDLEVWYVQHQSFWLDLKILWMTISVILLGHKPNPIAIAEARRFAIKEQTAASDSQCVAR